MKIKEEPLGAAAAAMLGKLHINEHNMILQKLILRLF